ncbi:hypothetical protein [Campylobacter insulaenigrae]|uniref:hypothetical protein n=1 Tax=Campylobacter insulaenigrae TaxID=260714 RepID=UPI0021532A12|nr:hypothetical protein [Campylobacter insulaenigrae]MCR6587967.1 hypothetical protein [Campylobacter insulaenigrae]
MHKQIQDFILSQKVLHLGIIDDDCGVYCASCYYAFDALNITLIFASHNNTKHIQLASKHPNISVSIACDNKSICLIKGIQAKAYFTKANKKQEKIYFDRFPFAKFTEANLYSLEIYWAKYTDNKKLFCKKLEFQRCL